MNRLRIKCPNCREAYKVPSDSLGGKARCKKCGETFSISLDLTINTTPSPETPSPQSNAQQQESNPTPSEAEPSPRKKIDKYLLGAPLGAGAMGEVFRAWDPRLARNLAIKLLPQEFSQDRERVRRFQNEARSAARLDHQNVVTVYEIGEDEGRVYIAMQYVEGDSLDRVISSQGAMPWQDATRVILDAARGLEAAHRQQTVHRDVKPANLLRDKGGVTLVADFGLAKALTASQQLTQDGTLLGTPAFMSPEQWQNKNVDNRSDLYSLVLTYYYLLTGETPFEADDPIALHYQHSQVPLPDPRNHCPELPDSVCTILTRGSQKAPKSRFQDAGELIEALESALEEREKDKWSVVKWVAAGLVAFICLLLSVVLFIKTDHGTVRIELPETDATLQVFIDGDTVELAGLEEPLKLKVGKHGLEVKSSQHEPFIQSLQIERGVNDPIRVSLTERVDREAVSEDVDSSSRISMAQPNEQEAPSGQSVTEAAESHTTERVANDAISDDTNSGSKAPPVPQTVPDAAADSSREFEPSPEIQLASNEASTAAGDFDSVPEMKSVLGIWTEGDAARTEFFRKQRDETRHGLKEFDCSRLIRVSMDGAGHPSYIPGPPMGAVDPFSSPGPQEESLPERFVLTGDLLAVRVEDQRSYLFVTSLGPRKAPVLGSFLEMATTVHSHTQIVPVVAIQFDTTALDTWMSDYRFGERVHVVVNRKAWAKRRHDNYFPPSELPPLARDALGEFRPISLHSFSGRICWCFAGEGIEKANLPESWIDPKLGRAYTLSNESDVQLSAEFFQRGGTHVQGANIAFSAKLDKISSTDGNVVAHFTYGLLTEGPIPVEVHFGSAVQVGEFLDYKRGSVVEVVGAVRETGRSKLQLSRIPPNIPPAEIIQLSCGIVLEGSRIRLENDPSSEVVVGNPPRSNVEIDKVTPELVDSAPEKMLGKEVLWSGKLYRLRRQNGTVHMVVSLTNSLTGLRYFEAYTTDGSFYESLADYVDQDASTKADVIEVNGVVRSYDAIAPRLQKSVPLLEIRGVRRSDDPRSAAIVGQLRASDTFRSSTMRTGLSAHFHDRPPVGTEISFPAIFYRYDSRDQAVEVTSSTEGLREKTKVRFIASNEAMFSDYRRDDVVEIRARLKDMETFELVGLEIFRSKNPLSLITVKGRQTPPLDFSKSRARWKAIRSKLKDNLGEQLTGWGLFSGVSAGFANGSPITRILVKSLYLESSYTITLEGHLDQQDMDIVRTFESDDEVCFEFKTLEPSGGSYYKANGQLVWIAKIAEPTNRATASGSN